jgi:hypothetical protein
VCCVCTVCVCVCVFVCVHRDIYKTYIYGARAQVEAGEGKEAAL